MRMTDKSEGATKPSRATSKRNSTTGEVVVKMHQALSSGAFKPGDRLPNEYELAAEYGVGRSAIREAVRELTAYGLLEVRHGTGTFVTSTPAQKSTSQVELREHLRRVAMQDLLELRLLIEPEVAALAARRATEEEIQKMREDVISLSSAVDGENVPEDVGFHLHLVAATHNNSLHRITSWIVEFFHQSEVHTSRDDYIDHAAILEAVENREPNLARELMRRHLREVGRKLNLEDTINVMAYSMPEESAELRPAKDTRRSPRGRHPTRK